jgi:hypothetical protein
LEFVVLPRLEALPAPAPAASSSKQSYNKEQQYRTDRSVDDCTDYSSAQMDADLWQQPIPDEGTHYPEDEVANDSETRTSHDLAGQPTCNDTHEQYDQQAFTRHMHSVTSLYSEGANLA